MHTSLPWKAKAYGEVLWFASVSPLLAFQRKVGEWTLLRYVFPIEAVGVATGREIAQWWNGIEIVFPGRHRGKCIRRA